MAGDWIKVQHSTPDKPEVMRMAESLGVEVEQVFGHLFRVWSWADQQSQNGHALSVTENDIDRVARHAGVALAMRNVGWLSGLNGALSFPNFSRHNGESAKKRALAAQRKRRERVTQTSRLERDKNATRGEESINTPAKEKVLHQKGKRFSLGDAPPEWITHCRAARPDLDAEFTFTRFKNHWLAKSGRDAAKLDWFATWKNWCSSERVQPGQQKRDAPAGTIPAGCIKCRTCGAIVGSYTDGQCDPCWRAR